MQMVPIATPVLHENQARCLTDFDGRNPAELGAHFQQHRMMASAECTNLGQGRLVPASLTSFRRLGHSLARLAGREEQWPPAEAEPSTAGVCGGGDVQQAQ